MGDGEGEGERAYRQQIEKYTHGACKCTRKRDMKRNTRKDRKRQK